MQLPILFRRQKGSASTDPAIGSDTAPTTTAPTGSKDNVLSCKIRDINGWPVQRVMVCWTTTASNPVALNGDLYVWEKTTQHWYKINDTALSLKPNQIFFFDVPAISEPASNAPNVLSGKAASNSIDVFLVITDPGTAVNGVYQIAMGPDLSNIGT